MSWVKQFNWALAVIDLFLSCGNTSVSGNFMRTIAENFQIIIDKQNSMDYNFPKILQAPANTFQINLAELSLDLKFNLELNELYRFANGTKLDEVSELTLGMIGLIPIHTFLNLGEAVRYYNTYIKNTDNSLSDFFLNFQTEYRPGKKLFPFIEDSAGNCYWVDLNVDTENYQRIFWTNTFGEEPGYAFNSLTSMFQTIADCYENNVMTVDEEKNLECDYAKFYRIAKQNNPNIKHWDTYIHD